MNFFLEIAGLSHFQVNSLLILQVPHFYNALDTFGPKSKLLAY